MFWAGMRPWATPEGCLRWSELLNWGSSSLMQSPAPDSRECSVIGLSEQILFVLCVTTASLLAASEEWIHIHNLSFSRVKMRPRCLALTHIANVLNDWGVSTHLKPVERERHWSCSKFSTLDFSLKMMFKSANFHKCWDLINAKYDDCTEARLLGAVFLWNPAWRQRRRAPTLGLGILERETRPRRLHIRSW